MSSITNSQTKTSLSSLTNTTDIEELRTRFTLERAQWLEEKTKVINYQKQLQLNYVQMTRKNKLLEAEVQQLTGELEVREEEQEEEGRGRGSVEGRPSPREGGSKPMISLTLPSDVTLC